MEAPVGSPWHVWQETATACVPKGFGEEQSQRVLGAQNVNPLHLWYHQCTSTAEGNLIVSPRSR